MALVAGMQQEGVEEVAGRYLVADSEGADRKEGRERGSQEEETGVLRLCPHVLAGFCIKTHQSLQKFEKTEKHMLVCTDCPQRHLIRTSRSQEHCARKCKKVKKNFTCR